MRKTLFITLGAVVLAVALSGTALATEKSFAVSATVPAAGGDVTFTATEILVDAEGNETWQPGEVAALNFGQLRWNSEEQFFFAERYFAIDMGAAVGGVGVPSNIEFSYVDTLNPNSGVNTRGGLGAKGTLTLNKAVFEADDVGVAGPVRLNAVAGLRTFTKEDFVGGWPRAYIGINTLATNPAGAEVFTSNDVSGEYIGILTITATLN